MGSVFNSELSTVLVGCVDVPETVSADYTFSKSHAGVDVLTLGLNQILAFNYRISFLGGVNCVSAEQDAVVCSGEDEAALRDHDDIESEVVDDVTACDDAARAECGGVGELTVLK